MEFTSSSFRMSLASKGDAMMVERGSFIPLLLPRSADWVWIHFMASSTVVRLNARYKTTIPGVPTSIWRVGKSYVAEQMSEV